MLSHNFPCLLILVLLVSPVLEASVISQMRPRRSILRYLGDEIEPPDAAVELNSTNFDAVLSNSPATYAIVEFFAHWCPACRNYKPQYENVARLFNGPEAVHPGIILMTRVDCAWKMNTNLCDRFSVSRYPMLLWGPPIKFASGKWDPKQEKNEIHSIDDARTAERLLNWINKKLGSSFSLEDEKYENENTLPWNASDPELISRAVYDVEEATTKAFEIILEHKMIKLDTRSPLIKFLQLLVAHHPSKRCRKGSADILVNFDDLWPSGLLPTGPHAASISKERDGLKGFWICGKEVPRGYWIFCRGSKNETRGFSCGLWVLLHSLSVRVGDGESHSAFTAICDFIHNFFLCDECRQHFYEMCLSVSTPLNTTRDLGLWLWRAHNKVNERLMIEEKDMKTEDPRFPKTIWPPKQLCNQCYFAPSSKSHGAALLDWNEDEVFKFLVKYYGENLVSSYKDSVSDSRDGESIVDDMAVSTNAVAVPVGAALAIALASCAFGALACFWRTQQKNRKQRKNLSKT
ncbi:LOW QUALITY PROTEIN: sulfhydryl oxidase 1-like [Dioscorea cayenensis subsp. rotundata]|uniref:Sulfhydryl oxidase n=1 Tax=Dioscorea cayennensis subsp. rotundata TaxID=55577 RepID=A0AB40AM57_DIOCR|nr:LOW QUALITY PROTEIN: sulfhydryl oxidase 1-like [Dioscorea cayenensis subsp. rotundata]